MNARNAAVIAGLNPRALYPVVDDKLTMFELLSPCRHPDAGRLRGLHSAATSAPGRDPRRRPGLRPEAGPRVVWPRGRLADRPSRGLPPPNGSTATVADLRRHPSDTLSGLYSLGGRPDRAMVQQRLKTHPAFERISYCRTPDVRVLVYRGEAALAMLRLPTLESGGRANLHQGGVGVGSIWRRAGQRGPSG